MSPGSCLSTSAPILRLPTSTVPCSSSIIQSLASPSAISSWPGCARTRSMHVAQQVGFGRREVAAAARTAASSSGRCDSRSQGPSSSRPGPAAALRWSGSACREPAVHSARLQQPLADFAGGGIGGGGQRPHAARRVGGGRGLPDHEAALRQQLFAGRRVFQQRGAQAQQAPALASGDSKKWENSSSSTRSTRGIAPLPRANAAPSPRSSTGRSRAELLAQALAHQLRGRRAPARVGIGAQLVRVRVAQPVQHGRAVQRARGFDIGQHQRRAVLARTPAAASGRARSRTGWPARACPAWRNRPATPGRRTQASRSSGQRPHLRSPRCGKPGLAGTRSIAPEPKISDCGLSLMLLTVRPSWRTAREVSR